MGVAVRVAVFGLGRVGLPFAVQAARSGHDVVGVDGRTTVVDSVNDGVVPFPADPELSEMLVAAQTAHSITATTDVDKAAAQTEVAVIAAPLIADQHNGAGFDAVSVTKLAAGSFRPGTLVIYETTGTGAEVRSRFTSAVQKASGLSIGHNLLVAFCPTNTSAGRSFTEPRRDPDLVVGADDLSTSLAATFYRNVLGSGALASVPRARTDSTASQPRKVATVSLAAS